MDKFSFIALWDVYQGLLTRTQQEITDMYFNLDLTVSEIAAEKGVSRQAVSDCMKTCKNQLEEYEEKLHLCRRLRDAELRTSVMLTSIDKWADELTRAHPELKAEADRLTDIIRKDYGKKTGD